jgi:hypothetical protein
MKTTLIILNLLAAVLVFPAMAILHKAHVMNAAGMYTELDRAQVIDRAQLEKMYPNEAKNDRYEIARRYIGPKKNEWIVGYPCVFGFLMNALLIGLFMQRKRKAEPSPGPYGSPAAGSPSGQA